MSRVRCGPVPIHAPTPRLPAKEKVDHRQLSGCFVKALPCENEPQSTIVTATSSTRTPMNSTKKRSMSWVIRWKREARRALPGREASRARSEALSRVRRSQPTGADRIAVLDDHLRAGVLNAPRTRNASRCRTERRTSTRQQRALRRACQLAEVAVDSVRRDLRHHQTQVSRRMP